MKSPETHEPEYHHANPYDDQPRFRSIPRPPQGDDPKDGDHQELCDDSGVGLGQNQIHEPVHEHNEPTMNLATSQHPVETILGTGLKRLLQWGVPLSVIAYLFGAPAPDDGLLAYTLIHLTVLQIATFLFTVEVSPLTDHPWFGHLRRPWLASSASLIAASVGFSALLTLATSAAARYDVSLQFLQLLSSLDIAWVVAALYLGSRRLWANPTAAVLGSLLVAACVGSIALYLMSVGFTPDGGWLVDGGEMLRIVIPSDTVAAIISLGVLGVAAHRADQRTTQPSPQS